MLTNNQTSFDGTVRNSPIADNETATLLGGGHA